MGYEEYLPIAAKYRVPIVVTGFEPLDILQGVLMCLQQLETGRAEVENQYTALRAPGRQPPGAGNSSARSSGSFPASGGVWARIPQSGLGLREAYKAFDAERKFGVAELRVEESSECLSGLVLQGKLKPRECPAFGVPLHARTSAGRHHGLFGRRLRRLLPIPARTARPLSR